MADRISVDLGGKHTGIIISANQSIQAECMELPSLSPGVLLGMGTLSRLNFQIFLNGIEVLQKGNQEPRHTCTIKGTDYNGKPGKKG